MRKLVVIAILGAGTVALVAATVGPLMSQVEVPSYTVERIERSIEVRAYPSMVVAGVAVQGARGRAISDGFKMLAGYIFGGNEKSKKVEMTAPVMQERTGEQGMWQVRFIMPRGLSLETLPKAKDSRVELSQVPAATYAVVRFSGFAREAALETKTMELTNYIKRTGLTARGSPIFAFYNPPWTLPFFRRNEVMIQVEN